MLRTNTNFLSHIEHLYESQPGKDITLKKYNKGNFIFKQNEANSRVAIIKDGFAKCFFTEENGKDFILEFLGKGEIIGEIEAIRGIKCLCNIEAVTGVEAYFFSTAYFKEMLNSSLPFNQLLIGELAERIINTSTRASSQQLYSIKHGLSKLLILQEKQDIKLSKQDMAAYLGVDLRSLNRVLKESREM